MTALPSPRWRRRKHARPSEIEDAALDVFAARGFAAARMDEIAARAGVSKAAIFVYFPTKLDLFKAVVTGRATANLDAVTEALTTQDLPFEARLSTILARMGVSLDRPELRGLAKVVIAEGGNFPEIARHWHDAIVSRMLGLLAAAIERGQAKGEVRGGDPHLMALSIIGPMILGGLWKTVMEPVGGAPLDLAALAAAHGETLTSGLLAGPQETAI